MNIRIRIRIITVGVDADVIDIWLFTLLLGCFAGIIFNNPMYLIIPCIKNPTVYFVYYEYDTVEGIIIACS